VEAPVVVASPFDLTIPPQDPKRELKIDPTELLEVKDFRVEGGAYFLDVFSECLYLHDDEEEEEGGGRRRKRRRRRWRRRWGRGGGGGKA